MVIRRSSPRRTVIPWSPFRDWDIEEMNLENLLGQPVMPSVRRTPVTQEGEWLPAIDIFEKDNRFVVKADIPGMKPGDIEVSVTDSSLTIKGEKKIETEVNEKDYYRSERMYGSFLRLIPLPSEVDTEKVEANYDDGVLEVSIPRMIKTKPQKVKVDIIKRS